MAAELLLYRRQSRSNSDAQRAIDTGKSASDEKAESERDPSQLTRIDKHKGVSRYLSGETSHELTSGESARILCRQMRTDHDIAWNNHTCSAYAILLRLGLTSLIPALASITRGHDPYA